MAVAETVLVPPSRSRKPQSLQVLIGAMTIAAIVGLVAIVVPLVTHGRVTPRNAPEAVVPDMSFGVQPFGRWEGVAHELEHKIKQATKPKPAGASEKPDSDSHDSVSVHVEQHVSQSTPGPGGTATNVHTSTNVAVNGETVESADHSTSSSHSVVVSNNGATHVSNTGTGKSSVSVHSSSHVSHKSPSRDDWDDRLDEWNDWGGRP